MKFARLALFLLVVTALVYPESESLGMGAFANTEGAILVAVDAALVNRTLDSPYVMFVVYAAAKDRPITVSRDGIVMVYKGREYSLPSVKEVRRNYGGGLRDLEFYGRLGKEGLTASWVRFYQFPDRTNFFPPLSWNSEVAVNRASAYNLMGFQTPLYFKNPGFVKGDKIFIKLRDDKNPQFVGECEVVLD